MAEDRKEFGAAGIVMLGILLVIILRAALEGFFPPLFGGRNIRELISAWPPSGVTNLRVGQFVVFLLLLARFYGGAYRFNQEQPKQLPRNTLLDIINLVFTFVLFCCFYVTATNVWSIDLFYALILVIHIIDSFWFMLVLPGLKSPSLIHVAGLFLNWNLLTFGAYVILSAIFWNDFWNDVDLSLQVSLLISVTVISLIDWAVLRDFYFRPERWHQRYEPRQDTGGNPAAAISGIEAPEPLDRNRE